MFKEPSFQRQDPLEGYSETFRKDVVRIGLERLFQGSHIDGTLKEWEAGRRFIANSIDRDGKILDIGCANGFLLRCLQEWSKHNIDPYGVDTDTALIEQARELYPEQKNHFVTLDENQGSEQSAYPKQFETVYWNVWDNFDVDDDRGRAFVQKAWQLTAPGGRLILGFYNPKREDIERKINQLAAQGFDVSHQQDSGKDRDEAIVTIDKPVV